MAHQMNEFFQQCRSQKKISPNLNQIEIKSNPSEHFHNFLNVKILNQNRKNWQSQKKKSKLEQWDLSEVQKLFSIYAEYGPQWKIIQTELSQKSANSIKNKFYSVLRAFLKELFQCHSELKSRHKLFPEISSKIILRFYEGRNEFYRFRGFGKKVLSMVNYDVSSEELVRLGEKKLKQIASIYQLIYKKRLDVAQNPLKSPKAEPPNQNLPVHSNFQSLQISQFSNIRYQAPSKLAYAYSPNFDYIFFPPLSIQKSENGTPPMQTFLIFDNNFMHQT